MNLFNSMHTFANIKKKSTPIPIPIYLTTNDDASTVIVKIYK